MTTEKRLFIAVPLSLLFWAMFVVAIVVMAGPAEFSRNLFMETKYTYADSDYVLNQCLRLWVVLVGALFVAAGFGFKAAEEIDGLPAWPLLAVLLIAAVGVAGYGVRREYRARAQVAAEVKAAERQRDSMERWAKQEAQLAEARAYCEANPDECNNNVFIGADVDNVIIGYGASSR